MDIFEGIHYYTSNNRPTEEGIYLWRRSPDSKGVETVSIDVRDSSLWYKSLLIAYIDDYPESEFVGPINDFDWNIMFDSIKKRDN